MRFALVVAMAALVGCNSFDYTATTVGTQTFRLVATPCGGGEHIAPISRVSD